MQSLPGSWAELTLLDGTSIKVRTGVKNLRIIDEPNEVWIRCDGDGDAVELRELQAIADKVSIFVLSYQSIDPSYTPRLV